MESSCPKPIFVIVLTMIKKPLSNPYPPHLKRFAAIAAVIFLQPFFRPIRYRAREHTRSMSEVHEPHYQNLVVECNWRDNPSFPLLALKKPRISPRIQGNASEAIDPLF